MTLQLVCACGNQLRVPEAHAGRRVQCPRCGAAQVVTGSAPARQAHRPGRPGKRAPLLALVLVVLLLAGGAALGWWWYSSREGAAAALPEDLTLIPADAPVFLSARLSELWDKPLAKQLLEEADKRGGTSFVDNALRQTGLRPADVQRVSFVFVDVERRIGWTVVKTVAPYDREAILAKLQNRRESHYQSVHYQVGDHPDAGEVALSFLTPTTLVASNDTGMKACLAHVRSLSRGTKGPLSPVLALCEGPHHVVAGYHPTPAARQQIADNEATANLPDVRRAQVTVDVGTEALVEVKAEAADETRAKELGGQINGWMGMGKAYLLLAGLKRGEEGKAAQQANMLLDQIKIEVQGAEVRATIKADAAGLLAALGAVPGLPGR